MQPSNNQQKFLFLIASMALLFFFMVMQWLQGRAEAQAVTAIEGVIACYPELQPLGDDWELLQAEQEARIEQTLAESPDPLDQALAIAAFTPVQERSTRLRTLLDQYSDQGRIALQLLSHCLQDITQSECAPPLLNQVAELNEYNGFAWQLIAKYRILQGDDNGAVASLRRASAAPEFEFYFLDQLRRFDVAVPDDGELVNNYTRLNILSSADDVQLYTQHASVSQYCAESAALRPDLVSHCVELGERTVAKNSGAIHQMLGFALLESTYLGAGDFAAANLVEDRAQRNRMRISEFDEAFTAAAKLASYDADLTQQWMADFISNGEISARQRLTAVAQERSGNPDYRPCAQAGLQFRFPYFYVGDERLVF